MIPEHYLATVLIVGDDVELCGLLAMNLRLRGFFVEQTSFALAVASRWEPSFGQPDLVIVDIESAERVSAGQVQRLGERPWFQGAPLLVAADHVPQAYRLLEAPPALMLTPASDVGAIVTAARDILGGSSVDPGLARLSHTQTTPA